MLTFLLVVVVLFRVVPIQAPSSAFFLLPPPPPHPAGSAARTDNFESNDCSRISGIMWKRRPYRRSFIFGEEKKPQGAKSGEQGGWRGHSHVFSGQR
jgi:hypothetical protein